MVLSVDVVLPRTLAEALERRAAEPESVPIAGGTDLMFEINFDKIRPQTLIDVSHLRELRELRSDGDGHVFLGAGVTYSRILRELPHQRALAQASRGVGSPQIRNAGTIGGNLGTASPAGEALPVLAAHDAEIGLVAGDRERWLPWNEFLVGVKRTTLQPDELIIGARYRALSGPQSYSKVGTRNAMVISIAMLCFAMDPPSRTVRVALGAVAPTAVRATDAETFLAAELERAGAWDELTAPVPNDVADGFAERVVAAATPIDDVRGTAAYRLHALRVLARRALGWAMQERADEAMVS
ncbi:MAG TPA: FAD binding domain-containing protein [Actinomycetota bacterium]|nr:FAD binding domain-containing protein [Actinomycetota bacterium]